MENTATELSGAEWEIMRIVWTLGEAKSTEIVHLMQQSKKWTASTIKTLLRRLVAKGASEVYLPSHHCRKTGDGVDDYRALCPHVQHEEGAGNHQFSCPDYLK